MPKIDLKFDILLVVAMLLVSTFIPIQPEDRVEVYYAKDDCSFELEPLSENEAGSYQISNENNFSIFSTIERDKVDINQTVELSKGQFIKIKNATIISTP